MLTSTASTPIDEAISGMAGVMMVASRISMKNAPATNRATPRGTDTVAPPDDHRLRVILALIERLVPDPGCRRKMLWESPMPLFGFDESPPRRDP